MQCNYITKKYMIAAFIGIALHAAALLIWIFMFCMNIISDNAIWMLLLRGFVCGFFIVLEVLRVVEYTKSFTAEQKLYKTTMIENNLM